MDSKTSSVEQSMQALESAIGKLEAAIDRRDQRQSESSDMEAEIQTLSADRARLADNLDQANAKIESLEAVYKDASNRLVNAMETVSAVLQADPENA
jgi:predicted  nucleic acid-binding Zn-ribbon protein